MSLKQRLANAPAPTPLMAPSPTRPVIRGERERSPIGVDVLGEQFLSLKKQAQETLLTQTDHPERLTPDELGRVVAGLVEHADGISLTERDALTRIIVHEITGYGPIQPLLDDPDVSEIMINGPDTVYIERLGRLERTRVTFRDAAHLKATLEKMLSFSGRHVDEASPMVDARLPDGSRLNAVVGPIAIQGDTITIRKFSRDPLSLAQLVERGTLSHAMAQFLSAAVRARLNIIISGGTGSGKTTTLNALSAFIPDNERIVTIEDAAELQLQQTHRVTLEARPPNVEGQGAIPIRALVRNALRMRPDRILVGEVRGAEALDMLQAMNTGHDGSLTTAHANSPRDCLSRLETMVLMAGTELPVSAIRQQVASALALIVQQTRLADGTRRVVRITEVVGMEEGIISTQDLFEFAQEHTESNGRVAGAFRASGIRPRHYERLSRQGIDLPASLFSPGATT